MSFKDALFAGTFTPGANLVFRLSTVAFFGWCLITGATYDMLLALAVFYIMFEWRNNSVEYMAGEINLTGLATAKLAEMLTKASVDISGLYHSIENLQTNQGLTESQKKLIARYQGAVAEIHSSGKKTPWEQFEGFLTKEEE